MPRLALGGRVRRAARAAGPVRARAAGPADLGHGPLQLPLPVLHAGGGVRARLRVPAQGPGASFEEITRLASIFVALGVHKLRITGGEPLVRRDLPELIRSLALLRTADGERVDLTLTTNGSALRSLAAPLADAGLQRITVSLDSLDDEVFGAMNGVDFPVSRVLDGIAAAATRASRRSRSTPSCAAA